MQRMDRKLTRSELLKAAAVAAPGLTLGRVAGASAKAKPKSLKGMNVILFITDQERAIQHFPGGWAKKHLPGMTRLQKHGVTFENAFTNACMCSPARSTLFSGYLPAQHGVKYTLEEKMPAAKYPQVELSTDLPNLGTVMNAAGYTSVYKGKWHASKAHTKRDLEKYGFDGWDPPDAGANQDLDQAGGGNADHDGRYMDDVRAYLGSRARKDQPFFLVVSLVNPHDVLFYPSHIEDSGYDSSWLKGDIDLPATWNENLATKPTAQALFLALVNFLGPIDTADQAREYLNFYANLMKASDAYLVDILDLLAKKKLLDDTLIIRTADHGEMGMAHGTLRQKNFNMYEESLRVPLVFSNPRLFPKAKRSSALVSHVDLLPTMASHFNAPKNARADWEGVDYSRNVLDPSAATRQSYTVFTFDDWQSGQPTPPYIPPPNHVVSVRETRWKIGRYYDTAGKVPDQWEFYDLENDPAEATNLAFAGHTRTAEQEREFQRLQGKLAKVQKTRLKPL
jgi:arylsulfatase A-like enzyme